MKREGKDGEKKADDAGLAEPPGERGGAVAGDTQPSDADGSDAAGNAVRSGGDGKGSAGDTDGGGAGRVPGAVGSGGSAGAPAGADGGGVVATVGPDGRFAYEAGEYPQSSMTNLRMAIGVLTELRAGGVKPGEAGMEQLRELARYGGAGGIKNAFDPRANGHDKGLMDAIKNIASGIKFRETIHGKHDARHA